MSSEPSIGAELRATDDGSYTLVHPKIGETYHSTFGAITESMHTYINAGFNHLINGNSQEVLHIFEMGFGSGLNALLTLIEAQRNRRQVVYHSIELYPLNLQTTSALNYGVHAGMDNNSMFNLLHATAWNTPIKISEYFTLYKQNCALQEVVFSNDYYNLIYFDAFSPSSQNDLWSLEVFGKIFAAAKQGCVFVTYCSKGDVKRALRAAGFLVERLNGAPGKRHMLRAIKP